MKSVDLQEFKLAFTKNVSLETRCLIDSFYVFGSMARGERITLGSDIDSVVLLKDMNRVDFSTIKNISHDFVKLDNDIGVDIDHVIVSQIELFELLSPMLILGMYTDGINIYGQNLKNKFKNYLAQVSKNKMMNSFLRSRMFYRHLFRKKFLKIDTGQLGQISDKLLISISKDIFLAARDVIYLKEKKYLSKKQDICSFFATHVVGDDWYVNLPLYAYNVRYLGATLTDEQRVDYLQKAFNFIELTTIELINLYKENTGETKLNLNPY